MPFFSSNSNTLTILILSMALRSDAALAQNKENLRGSDSFWSHPRELDGHAGTCTECNFGTSGNCKHEITGQCWDMPNGCSAGLIDCGAPCECSSDSDCDGLYSGDKPFCGAADGTFGVGRGECTCYKCIRDTYPSGQDTGCSEHLPKCAGPDSIPTNVGGSICTNPDDFIAEPTSSPSTSPSDTPSQSISCPCNTPGSFFEGFLNGDISFDLSTDSCIYTDETNKNGLAFGIFMGSNGGTVSEDSPGSDNWFCNSYPGISSDFFSPEVGRYCDALLRDALTNLNGIDVTTKCILE